MNYYCAFLAVQLTIASLDFSDLSDSSNSSDLSVLGDSNDLSNSSDLYDSSDLRVILVMII